MLQSHHSQSKKKNDYFAQIVLRIMEAWTLWYELGCKAKNAEITWFLKRLSDSPPTDNEKITKIERELTIFRHIHLHFSEGDIFIAFSRIDNLEELIKSC